MSELKAYRPRELVMQGRHNEPIYLKSEADKVIAEKDAEIASLKAIRKVHVEAIESMEAGLLQNDEEFRHHKYKRCLNNAWWLLREEFFAEDCHCERWVDWAIKWYKRWLELAEKFKEGV